MYKKLIQKIKKYISHKWPKKSPCDSPPPPPRTFQEKLYRLSYYKKYKLPFSKKKEKKDILKLIPFTLLLACSACSKRQEVKIVHNYWNKVPLLETAKQQVELDFYTYKSFKDSNKKEKVIIYKPDMIFEKTTH